MKRNVGTIDRSFRAIAGLAVLALYFVLEGDMRYWALVGLGPLGTALIGWCPPYMIFGIDTCAAGGDD